MMKTENELGAELVGFKNIWRGGFYPGKVKDKIKSWGEVVKIQPLFHKALENCIKPYVNEDTSVLEIGCGGGFYTQHFVHAKKLVCFDALSAKHNKFWDRIANKGNIKYFRVKDFGCNEIGDNSVDYLFSFNVFVHISYSGADAYLQNLHKKLRNGANCFIQILDIKPGYVYNKHRDSKLLVKSGFKPSQLDEFLADYDGEPRKGRMYLYGVDRFCNLLEKYGYVIVSRDILNSFGDDVFPSAPAIHFRKS